MTNELKAFKAAYPVVIELPVQWGDMDALEHVNNVVYLRWFESARIAYFDRVSFMSRLREEKIGPILASSEIKYRAPIEYPDTVFVGAKVKRLGTDDLVQQYEIFSSAKNRVTTSGESRIVMYHFGQQTKVTIPDDIANNIRLLEEV